MEQLAPTRHVPLYGSWMSLPNRELVLLRDVLALPNASSTGFELIILSTIWEFSLAAEFSAAVVARNFSTSFVVSAAFRKGNKQPTHTHNFGRTSL